MAGAEGIADGEESVHRDGHAGPHGRELGHHHGEEAHLRGRGEAEEGRGEGGREEEGETGRMWSQRRQALSSPALAHPKQSGGKMRRLKRRTQKSKRESPARYVLIEERIYNRTRG